MLQEDYAIRKALVFCHYFYPQNENGHIAQRCDQRIDIATLVLSRSQEAIFSPALSYKVPTKLHVRPRPPTIDPTISHERP
jgi:hypothetical protein